MILRLKAKEESTYIIDVTFIDSTGQSIIPDSAVWSLLDSSGEIINEREDITLSGGTIVLSGNDLVVSDTVRSERIVLVKATYTGEEGAGLPINDTATFYVENLVGVGE